MAQTGTMNAVPAPATTLAVPTNPHPMASLYVGDLNGSVTESMLYSKFAAVGPVLSIRVCRDAITRRSLGYAYVNFQNPADAERALETMNFDPVEGKPIRLMWAQRDPTLRRAGTGNIFIKNLDPHIDVKSIYDTFSMFGPILSCKIATDNEGKSKGYGFIHFSTEEAAQKAIEKVNGMLLDNKTVYVGKFQPRAVRVRELGDLAYRFNNVYVKNFADALDDAGLRKLFEPFGSIISCVVMKDSEGKSRGFGFCSFEKTEDAERAVKELNDKDVPDTDRKLTVCRAQKKSERLAELSRIYAQNKADRLQRYQGVNLYVKNLDDAVNSEELQKRFAEYGNITSVKVMVDESGRSKGFGFVCFEKPDEATRAVVEMNNRMFEGKPLYVALAQRREERRAQLASQYMQRAASMRLQGPAVGMPLYAPNNPTAGYYLQSVPGAALQQRAPFIPNPMAAQQMRGGNMGRWSSNPMAQYGAPMPGYMVQQSNPQQQQFNRPRQQHYGNRGQYQGNRSNQSGGPRTQQQQGNRGGGFYQQPQHQAPQQQQAHPAVAAQQQQQQVMQGVPVVKQENLASKLAAVSSVKEQKQVLGESLYPLVHKLCSEDKVGQVVGMMLEWEDAEILRLLDNPSQLDSCVQQAVQTLESAQKQQTA